MKTAALQAQAVRVNTERLERLEVLRFFGLPEQIKLREGTKLDIGDIVEVVRKTDGAVVETISIHPEENRVIRFKAYDRTQLGRRSALVLKSDVKVGPADNFYPESVRQYEDLMGMKPGEAIR